MFVSRVIQRDIYIRTIFYTRRDLLIKNESGTVIKKSGWFLGFFSAVGEEL